MTDTTQSQQAVYGSKEVANLLEVQESTLRKYCLILQEQGYEFLKNEHGHRAFFDNDLIALRKFLKLKSEGDMTLDDAAKSVVAWVKGENVTGVVTEDLRYVDRYNDLVEEFQDFKEQQMSYNEKLLEELQKQQEYINNRLEQRDHVLMESLRELQESRKQLASTEEKKKSWWQFWK